MGQKSRLRLSDRLRHPEGIMSICRGVWDCYFHFICKPACHARRTRKEIVKVMTHICILWRPWMSEPHFMRVISEAYLQQCTKRSLWNENLQYFAVTSTVGWWVNLTQQLKSQVKVLTTTEVNEKHSFNVEGFMLALSFWLILSLAQAHSGWPLLPAATFTF